MSREKINWKIEELDLKEFINPISIEIPIDKGQYNYIFNGIKINNITAKDYCKSIEKYIADKIFTKDNKYKKYFYYDLSLSYIPDYKNNCYKIGYSVVKIFNNIFDILGINEKLDYINYDNINEVNDLRRRIHLILIDEKLKYLKDKNNEDKFLFIQDILNNLDNIFSLVTYDIESKIKNNIIYKNLLYYLAVKSLDILDETDDIKYGILPKQYFIEVSSVGKAEFPRQLFMSDTEVYSYNYTNYNDRYNDILLRYPILFEESIGINEIGVMDELDIVKADNFIKEVEEDYFGYIKTYKKKKTYTKTDIELNEMLNDKINFYRELLNMKDEKGEKLVISPVKGKNSLQGYYGFVFNNNYIALDKFFSVRKDNLKLKPSFDEAIYSMPLDLFVDLKGSKRLMMDYIKKNPKGNVKRNYHTKKHSYRDRVLEVSKKDDVSTMKNDWFLSIYAPKKLVLEN